MALVFMKMVIIISILGLASASTNPFFIANSSNNTDTVELSMTARHEQWMAQFGRVYEDDAEKEVRFKIFKNNVEYIEAFNRAGGRQYKLGVNKFADVTIEEFKVSHSNFRPKPLKESSIDETNNQTTVKRHFKYEKKSDVPDLPESKDWREEGAVTPIKEMGSCTCSWTFSAVAAIEGINQITSKNLISLSEQQLLDCVVAGNHDQCYAEGDYVYAFQFVIDNHGIASEDSYPYHNAFDMCDDDAQVAVTISAFVKVPTKNEAELLIAVAQQPVSVAIDADSTEFMFYEGNIFDGPCGTNLSHSMTIVGYGTDPDQGKYWLAKNADGDGWGEDGYMRIRREVEQPEGMCGIAMEPVYPVI